MDIKSRLSLMGACAVMGLGIVVDNSVVKTVSLTTAVLTTVTVAMVPNGPSAGTPAPTPVNTAAAAGVGPTPKPVKRQVQPQRPAPAQPQLPVSAVSTAHPVHTAGENLVSLDQLLANLPQAPTAEAAAEAGQETPTLGPPVYKPNYQDIGALLKGLPIPTPS